MASKQEVKQIPISQIVANKDWNMRSGDFTVPQEGDENNDFTRLKASIATHGILEPVKARPKGQKFELIAGFRRFEAATQLAKEKGEKDATIPVIVEDLDDLQARTLNLTENINDKPKGSDLGWALFELQKQYRVKNVEISDKALTDSVGMNQSYGGKLLTIYNKCTPKVVKLWRESPIQLPVIEMVAVSKVDKDRQEEEYNLRLKKKQPKDKRDKTAQYKESVIKRVSKFAAAIGYLEREGFMNTDNLDFNEESHMMNVYTAIGLKLKDDTTPAQKKAFANAANEAFQKALTETPAEDDDSEDEDAA